MALDAKVFLSRYLQQEKRCAALSNKIADLRSMKPSWNMSGVKSTRKTDALSSTAVKVVDAENQLEQYVDDLNATMMEILHAIEAVDNEMQKNVLTFRYINGLSWFDICDKMGYEKTRVFVFHSRALKQVQKWLDERGDL